MYAKLLYFVSVICHFYSSSSTKAPFIKKCLAADTQCITNNGKTALPLFSAGIPDLGVEALDPMVLKKIDASSQSLKLILFDVTVKGLQNCLIHRIERDFQKSKLYIITECTVDVSGKYVLDGNILLLSVQGNGNANFKLRKAVFEFSCDMSEKKGKDGQIYFHLKNAMYSYTLNDKSQVNFKNIFNGNEILGRATRALFDTNPNVVVLEIGPPIIKAVIEKMVVIMNTFFRTVPASDLVLFEK